MVYVAPERPNVVGDVLTLARQQVVSRGDVSRRSVKLLH